MFTSEKRTVNISPCVQYANVKQRTNSMQQHDLINRLVCHNDLRRKIEKIYLFIVDNALLLLCVKNLFLLYIVSLVHDLSVIRKRTRKNLKNIGTSYLRYKMNDKHFNINNIKSNCSSYVHGDLSVAAWNLLCCDNEHIEVKGIWKREQKNPFLNDACKS